MVIVSGGIDLSVGSLVTLSAVTVTQTMFVAHLPFFVAICVALVVSIVFGILNGVGVGFIKIPSLRMTLASSTIAKGVALLLTNGCLMRYGMPPSRLGSSSLDVFDD